MSSFVDSSLNHYPEFHREVIRTVIYRLENDMRVNHVEEINRILSVDDTVVESQNGKMAKKIKRTKKMDNLSTFEENFKQ
jgi:hypothetical protein